MVVVVAVVVCCCGGSTTTHEAVCTCGALDSCIIQMAWSRALNGECSCCTVYHHYHQLRTSQGGGEDHSAYTGPMCNDSGEWRLMQNGRVPEQQCCLKWLQAAIDRHPEDPKALAVDTPHSPSFPQKAMNIKKKRPALKRK